MIIIVDQNEKATNPKIVSNLEKYFSKIIIANLNAGDVNIPLDDGSVLAIERKAPHDFLSSIADGRIFEQVESMALHAKYSAFIVTGSFTYRDKSDMCCIDGQDTNWKGASVRSTMNVIQYSGCPVIFCPENKYPEMIAEIYNTVNKPDERRAIRKNRIITFPPIDERIQFLAQFPGIGLKTAEEWLKFAGMMDDNADADGYGTIASALEWVTIMSGIDKDVRPLGTNKILTIRKFMGLASNAYMRQEISTDDNKETVTKE
jgi:ERCC4-type nuclease